MGSLRGLFTVLIVLGLFATHPTAAPQFSGWSAPTNLDLVQVNSAFNDQAPAVSKDGLSLYFQSDRPDPTAFGAMDLWVSRRDSVDEPWGPPENLGGAINSSSFESRPSLSRDGHWLFFSSNRPGGHSPGLDIWASYREHVDDDFGWRTPDNLGTGVNAGGSSEIEASYFENDDGSAPLLFFVSNRLGGLGAFDVYVSELLADGTWGPATWVPDLSSTLPDQSVSVRFDGLEAFIVKGDPPLPAGFDLWVSTRETVFDRWSEPVKLDSVNSNLDESSAHIASDRRTLYFESSRPGGAGLQDLWMTTRTRR
jgi:WD40-like Beta Propeller Repeat